VRATDKDKSAMAPINRGFLTAGILTVIGTFLVAQFYVHNLRVAWAVVSGLVLAQVASRITEYFTSTETAPVREIAEAARTGPATTVLSGISSGLESSVYAIILIAIALGSAIALGDNNLQFSLYLVALTGMGMLATTGVVVSEDTFGPVSDNAAGIAEMSGEFEGEPERIMVSLDAVGNTTKAVTKGFAIGSAVIAAVALFASFIETIGSELDLRGANGAIKAGTRPSYAFCPALSGCCSRVGAAVSGVSGVSAVLRSPSRLTPAGPQSHAARKQAATTNGATPERMAFIA